jgi:hypothetical protein
MSVNFETFCDHAEHGRLAHVQRMLESGTLRIDANAHFALVRAALNGHVDVVDYLLRLVFRCSTRQPTTTVP